MISHEQEKELKIFAIQIRLEVIKALGCQEVMTVLNSGNVVFTTEDENVTITSKIIEEALFMRIGVTAKAIVLTSEEIGVIVDNNPLVEIAIEPSHLLIAFLASPENKNQLAPLEQQVWFPEVLAVGLHAAYLWCPDRVIASRLSASVNRALGENVTSRNWATLMKIHAISSKNPK